MLEDVRAQVASTCRRLRREGLVVGTAGNVSARAGELVAISPSGVDYDVLDAEHVGVHRTDGTPVEAPLSPSSELPLHLAIYDRTDAEAIVHTHAVASTALSTLVDEVPATHYYTAMFGGPIRVAPYATFGSDELAANVAAALQGRTAALLSNHGAVCIGRTLDKVGDLVGYLEYVCDVQLRAMSAGRDARVLPLDEIAKVASLLAGYGQDVGSSRPPTSATASTVERPA